MVVSLQMQIYLVAGIAGIVGGALIVAVITLFVVMEQLRAQLRRLQDAAAKTTNETVLGKPHHQGRLAPMVPVNDGQENYAFTQPDIKPGEELGRRGFVMSADQMVPPRLHRLDNGMYGAVVPPTPRDNSQFDERITDGTRDASEDFVVNHHHQPSPIRTPTHHQQLRNVAARPPPFDDNMTTSSTSMNDLAGAFPSSSDRQRKRSQFNNNIMLADNNNNNNNSNHSNYHQHHLMQSGNLASTEFPSIDYDDVVSASSTNYYGETSIRNEVVLDERRKHQQHY